MGSEGVRTVRMSEPPAVVGGQFVIIAPVISTEEEMEDVAAFDEAKTSNSERAIALLWWHGLENHDVGKSASQLANDLEAAGFGQQNATRLRTSLEKDRRVTKTRLGTFCIRATARALLDTEYLDLLQTRPIRRSNSIVPLELFVGTRLYIERVVLQLNASYDAGLYDCCAVMCRRLLETLIIEVYEAHTRAGELKGGDGHFMMFSGLLSVIERDKAFNLGRNSIQGLRDFKKLGDLSAHNRRYNARSDDIDRIRDGLRVAIEELLNLAKLLN